MLGKITWMPFLLILLLGSIFDFHEFTEFPGEPPWISRSYHGEIIQYISILWWTSSSRNINRQSYYQKQHYSDVIMGTVACQITSIRIVYSTVFQAQIKENIKAPRHWPLCGVTSQHKCPVTRKMFSLYDVILRKPSTHLQLPTSEKPGVNTQHRCS